MSFLTRLIADLEGVLTAARHLIVTHWFAFALVFGYWILEALISGMPQPTDTSPWTYKWLFTSAHVFAANLDKAGAAIKGLLRKTPDVTEPAMGIPRPTTNVGPLSTPTPTPNPNPPQTSPISPSTEKKP